MLLRLRKLYRFESPNFNDWIIYFGAFILLQIPAIINFYYNDGSNNPYTLFAEALLHGQLSLPHMNSYGDMIFYHNTYYLPYPPLPSLILLPFVALLGASHVNTVAIATVMACISLYQIHKILLKLNVQQEYHNWMVAALIFGTGYWYALFTSHHVYAFAHVTSFMFQLLLINEVMGKRRWWLAGLYIGCSFFTRQFTLFYVVFALGYMLYLHQTGKEKMALKYLVSLCLPIGLFIGVYLWYNYVRFGNAFTTGYDHILFIGVLKERVNEYGVFNVRYFLFNLYSFLIKGFNIEFQGKDYLSIKDMDLWGTSLLAASPFFIASLKAEWSKTLKIASWLTVVFILAGQLFYHNNGFHQINTSRFALDFLPLLFVLTACGVNHIPKWLFKGMVLYAILLNLISFIIHSIYQ
jgi:hypothetical protein